jgi:hypothetical protein
MNKQTLKTLGMALGLVLALAAGAAAQPFSSGSTGADGAYVANVSGDFDPNNLTATCTTCTSNNVVNAAADNVFNFTTITINAGITVRLRASKVRNMPVFWLATGNVAISGTLNLTGDTGYTLDASNPTQIAQIRRPAEPGAGGYYGGLGARGGIGPEAGAGPGGGAPGLNNAANTCYGGSGSFITAGFGGSYNPTGVGPTYGNTYLVPLYGGSGGGGGWGSVANTTGGGGGGGGGAIRIVSTTQITVTGAINANGGSFGTVSNGSGFCQGGPGAGGAIHLIAPTIGGAGPLNAVSGINPSSQSVNNGYVRFNVTNYSYTGTIDNSLAGVNAPNNTTSYAFVGPLYNVPANSTISQPSLVLTQVNGINVPNPPVGAYLTPDVQINANTPVTVSLSAANIPLGTLPVLRLTSETAGDQSITCAALAGTLAASTSTCSATFPFSISIASLRAMW